MPPKKKAPRAISSKCAAAKPPSKVSTQDDLVTPTASLDSLPQEPPSKRRQLRRRGSDDKVTRAMETRLRDIPESQLEGKRNSDGLTVREYIKQELRHAEREKRRLGSRFWSTLLVDFKLSTSIADGLADPPDGEVVDEQLVQLLEVAHSDNPAARRTQPLERYLEHCAVLNRDSLYGLLGAIQACPSLLRSAALKCQLATLKYIARSRPQ